jgi:hypothetical protein
VTASRSGIPSPDPRLTPLRAARRARHLRPDAAASTHRGCLPQWAHVESRRMSSRPRRPYFSQKKITTATRRRSTHSRLRARRLSCVRGFSIHNTARRALAAPNQHYFTTRPRVDTKGRSRSHRTNSLTTTHVVSRRRRHVFFSV